MQRAAGIAGLYKVIEWTAHRSGPELIAQAKEQQSDSAEENRESDGNVRDSVPIIDDFANKLDDSVRALLDKFGVLQGAFTCRHSFPIPASSC